jgi:DNA polymerase-3 subunit delta
VAGGSDPNRLVAAITAGQIAPVYLLWGPDQAALAKVVEALRATVLRPGGVSTGMEAFNHEQFDAPYLGAASQVLNACAQVPMLADRRLIELSSPEDFGRHKRDDELDGSSKPLESKRDDAIKALIEYFAAPNPTTVLVVTSSGLNGKSKLVNAAKKSKGVVEHKFEPPSEGDAARGLQAEAKRLGFELSPAAARTLVDAVGTTLSELIPALERAAAFAGAGIRVEREHVDAVVATTREANVFDLTNAIGRGDHVQALEILARMFSTKEKDPGQAMRLLGMLLWQTRQQCTTAFARPGPANHRLRAAYAGLARLDSDLKGGSKLAYESPYMALQRWILDVCQALPGVDPRR